MARKIDRPELQARFLAALQGEAYRLVEGLNPFRISLASAEYWIYIKNLTSAHFENPDVWRAQLPHRGEFDEIKKSDEVFLLLGYDDENDVYATWNPIWVKQRLNETGNVSFYSRHSLQVQARRESAFKKKELNNDGELLVFPRESLRTFLSDFSNCFRGSGDYVAIGSKRRPKANEAFKVFSNASNIAEFARRLVDEGKSSNIVSDHCRVIRTLIAEGAFSRSRKLFLRYDTLSEYPNAVGQFVENEATAGKPREACEKIRAALFAYISFLTRPFAPKPSGAPLHMEKKRTEKEKLVAEASPYTSHDLFRYFCSDAARESFEEYLNRKNPAKTIPYKRAINVLILNGRMIPASETLFSSLASYSEYRPAINEFCSEHGIAENDVRHIALCEYARFLSRALSRGNIDFSLSDDNEDSSAGCAPTEDEPDYFGHDWEAEYTTDGKLTCIANPELLKLLRPYLATEYPKRVAAYNVIERFYGDRFPKMEISDWSRLIDRIDWSDFFHS